MMVAKGLEGVVIDTSSICRIDGNEGRLIYRGYDIHDLSSNLSFEEVAYLLWNGDLPTQDQLSDLKKHLIAERPVTDSLKNAIRKLPTSSDSLDVLRTAISPLPTVLPIKESVLGEGEATAAKGPTITAAFDRI